MDGPTLLLLLAYASLLLWLSLGRSEASPAQYLLAGRKLTLPALILTLVTTWYGGILGVGEYTWRYGISTWIVFGVPYYLAAILFALILAPRLRKSEAVSIPDLLQRYYGRGPALTGAVGVWFATLPVAYLLMLAVLIHRLTGLELVYSTLIGAGFSAWYVGASGFRAVVRTDALQFFLMYLGFAILLPLALRETGGFSGLWAALPPSHRSWDGGLGWQGVLVWYLIALQTVVEPAFYQRVFAAKDQRTARNGVLISVCFWLLFDFLSTFTALAARVLLPELKDPLQAYPALASSLLPSWAAAIFTVSLFAIIMSTLDSYLFLSASTMGYDFKPGRIEKGRIRAGIWLAALISGIASLFFSSAVRIWHDIGSILTSALLLPLLAIHLPPRLRPTSRAVEASIICSALTAVIWIGWPGGYPAGIEPMFPALGVACLFCIPSMILKSRGGRISESEKLDNSTVS